MTPKELYNILCEQMAEYEVPSICYLEKNCVKNNFCLASQSTKVLNFDEVKNKHFRDLKKTTPKSVDALSAGKKGTAICFVEMKGWKNYLANIAQQRKSIAETAQGYGLAKKLEDSQNICIELTKEPALFADMPVRFILVTDINPDTSGLEYLHSMLTALGETTTELYSQCITESKNILDSAICIDKYYIQCREFDKFIANI